MTTPNRIVYIDGHGGPQCFTVTGGVVNIPAEFNSALTALCGDLQLALECIKLFGGVPIPVAKAILRNAEPAHAAIDMAVRNAAPKAEPEVR